MAGGFMRMVSESALGHAADRLHQRLFAGMPWATLAIIGGVWDFVDILLRLPGMLVKYGLPALFVPTQMVLSVLDVLLVFWGVALWGSTGLLQAIELVFAPVPIFGDVLDFVPVLTVCAFIVRRRQKEATRESGWYGSTMLVSSRDLYLKKYQKEDRMLVWLSEIILIVVWWKFGLVGSFWLVVAGILLPVISTLLAKLVPVRVRLPLVALGLVTTITTAGLYYWSSKTSPEDYREKAWMALVAEEDRHVLRARKVDEMGPAFELDLGDLVGQAKEKTTSGACSMLGSAAGHDFGFGLFNRLVRAANEAGCLESPAKEEPKEKEKPAVKVEKLTSPIEESTQRLALGKAQTALYKSRYVLAKAKDLQDASISFWGTLTFWSLWVLLVAISLLLAPRNGEGGPSDVSEEGGGSSNDSGSDPLDHMI